MRRFALIHLVWLSLTLPAVARAQLVAAPSARVDPEARSGQAPPADSQAKPGPQKPPAPPPAKPQPAPAAAEPAAEVSRSLFEQTWHQFEFSGRVSSIDGDPARFQRYGDLRDGVLFTDARQAGEHPEGDWLYRVAADNVGWRDQRFFGAYERPGRFAISGLWDEIPQFYSVDTKTPFTMADGALVLDDATQRAIQNGQANLNAYVPIAPQFDLQERRDIGKVSFTATPTPQIDVTAAFTTQRHVGELPWGASFGFSNDVEVALPYDSRTNDFTLGAEWTNSRSTPPTVAPGSTTSTTRWSGTARSTSPIRSTTRGGGGCRSGRRIRHRL
jgi:hypothetical protein